MVLLGIVILLSQLECVVHSLLFFVIEYLFQGEK